MSQISIFRRVVPTIGFIVAGQLAQVCTGPGVLTQETCSAAPQGRRADARPVWQATPIDPERFFEQFMGKETEAQKRKLAEIEISWEQEQRFGKQTLQAFLNELRQKGIRVVSRGSEVTYLQSLVNELRPLMRQAGRYRKIIVMVAETDATDARCFPGGTLIVFGGMLRACKSEAAVVAVLAHELSHIDHAHQLRHLKSMKLAQQTFSAPQGASNVEQMMDNTMLFAQAFARPFRPEQETEADSDGVAWAYQKGYDPREFAKLFLWMDRRDKGKNIPLPTFFRSHPDHRDRYEAVMAQFDRLQRSEPQDDLYVGHKNLIELVPRSRRKYDE